jgi:uncharacterized integral membrane protein
MAHAPTSSARPARAPSRVRRWAPLAVGVAALVIFIVQNTEKVTLHFLVANFTWPLWLYSLVMAAIGAMVWFGAGVVRRRRRRRERRDGRY